MANDLDDIRATIDCPVCGQELSVAYRTSRLELTIECQECGETIKLEDHTLLLAAAQRLNDAKMIWSGSHHLTSRGSSHA